MSTSTELRLVLFVKDYWHVVSDEHASIIGSLYFMSKARLPWRAEFTGMMTKSWPQLEVNYFKTKEEAMAFLRVQLEAMDE